MPLVSNVEDLSDALDTCFTTSSIGSGGRKADTGKLRYDLLPTRALEALVYVYSIGAGKYADRNWERGLEYGRVFAAMQRHAWAWWGGQEYDPVDGQAHLASVAWCALALLHYSLHPGEYDEFDNRPPRLESVEYHT